jgi:hypothetical protein
MEHTIQYQVRRWDGAHSAVLVGNAGDIEGEGEEPCKNKPEENVLGFTSTVL